MFRMLGVIGQVYRPTPAKHADAEVRQIQRHVGVRRGRGEGGITADVADIHRYWIGDCTHVQTRARTRDSTPRCRHSGRVRATR